jgi:phospholipid/cholesterol/gamma-HCH transport system permease protein
MALVELIADFGGFLLEGLDRLGNFVLFLAYSLIYIITPPYKPRLTMIQIRSIGAQSIFLIALISAFTGMVLGLQGYHTLRQFGAEGALGTLISLTLVRELGPVLTALMIAARAGSAMAAELGSMQATEQIDALTVMAINPVQYLVSPRILAGICSFPLLTAVFDVIGIFGGYLVGILLMSGPAGSYWNGIAANMHGADIMQGVYKSLMFGIVVTWVCCYKGYHAQRMATGVSRATTDAVVLSSILILASDYVIGAMLL